MGWIQYQTLTTLSATRGSRPYQARDQYTPTWSDMIPADDHVEVVLHRIWVAHTEGRPTLPRLAVGDLIAIDSHTFTIDHVGFIPVEIDPEDLVLPVLGWAQP